MLRASSVHVSLEKNMVMFCNVALRQKSILFLHNSALYCHNKIGHRGTQGH